MKEISLADRKRVQLEIMKEIDFFCKNHNLTYYLAFGTLLGAIRHKGYIPWDDDIDIMMPRKDYNELAKIFPRNGRYRFLTHDNTKNFPYAFGKVIDTITVKNESIRPKYQVIGLDVDVFPIDNYPDDIEEARRWSAEIAKTQLLLEKQFAQFAKGRNLARTIVRNILIAIRHFLDDINVYSVNNITKQIDKLAQKYNAEETSYCGIADIKTYGVCKRNRKQVFDSAIEVVFEEEIFYAPIGYDEYLTDIYGNYMQLPPPEMCKTHHSFKAYWK